VGHRQCDFHHIVGSVAVSAPGGVDVHIRVLAALVGDDPATIADFLQDFAASAKLIGADLLAACAAGDALQAQTLAHKLKSSARSVGALQLGELCQQMEAAGKSGDSKALAELLLGFERELAAVQACLAGLT
jgi:two-component system sensor histidine kinase/response regulator